MLARSLLGVALLVGTTAASSAQTPTLSSPDRPNGPPARLASPVSVIPPEATWRAATLNRPVAATADTPAPMPTTPTVSPRAAAAGLTARDLGCVPGCDLSGDCDGCGPPGRTWVNFQWLFWATSGQPLPVLASSAPVGTARSIAGTLGSPPTDPLFGGQRSNTDFRNGFRLTGGLWLNEQRTFGVEGDFFFLGQSRDAFAAGGNGVPIVSRPFFNALTGRQDVELVSYPGVLAGRLTAEAKSNVIGAGVNAVHNICCDESGRVDLLYGYRYLGLTDSVRIREDLTALGGQSRVPAGFRYEISDRFHTQNNFNGGLIGVSAERRFGMLFASVRASVALGANRQTTTIDGTTVAIQPNGLRTAYPGGLLTQPSNIGTYDRTAFAVMPEVGVRFGVQLGDHARLFAGYNFIYLSSVARAGDQIDVRVNPNQLPPRTGFSGPPLPAFTPRTTDFWMQGVNVGLELRF